MPVTWEASPNAFRHQGQKQTRADARLQHAAAAPSQRSKPCPDRPDDELGRKMGVLGAARERGIVALADRFLQIGADFVPALAEIDLARPAEDTIRKIGRTETGEADQRSCSSAVAGRSSASISTASRIAATLSRARSFQPRARPRSSAR
jgi:hypothetical protein